MRVIYCPTEHSSYAQLVQNHFDKSVEYLQKMKYYRKLARIESDQTKKNVYYKKAIFYNKMDLKCQFKWSFGFSIYMNIVNNVN